MDVGEVERLSTAVGVVTPLFGAVEAADEEVEERFERVKSPILGMLCGFDVVGSAADNRMQVQSSVWALRREKTVNPMSLCMDCDPMVRLYASFGDADQLWMYRLKGIFARRRRLRWWMWFDDCCTDVDRL